MDTCPMEALRERDSMFTVIHEIIERVEVWTLVVFYHAFLSEGPHNIAMWGHVCLHCLPWKGVGGWSVGYSSHWAWLTRISDIAVISF